MKQNTLKLIKKHWQLYLVVALPVIYLLVFKYYPMYGAQIAFRNYTVTGGVSGSEWVGFEHFLKFFDSFQFKRLITNTLTISLYSLVAGFPLPIILALSLNEMSNLRFKKLVQMVTYMPHFISTVVLVSMVMQFLAPKTGLINLMLGLFGTESINFMGEADYFQSIYVWSGVWQGTGYGSIVYIAALSGVDPSLQEAAVVDGASRFQKIIHINIPCILPTAIIMLIMNMGRIMSVGFEKIFLLQNPINQRASEVISTYVYKIGLVGVDYSFSTAVGLFNSIVNLVLLVGVNAIAKRVGETSLW